MLDQLVESKSHMNEDKRRSSFMLVTLIVAVIGVLTAWGVDLFRKDFGMGGDDLSLTTLVAPVAVTEEEPPPPEPDKPKNEPKPEVATRTELYARPEDSYKIPDKADNTKAVKAIPKYGDFVKGSTDTDTAATTTRPGREVDTQGTGLAGGSGGDSKGDSGPPPPPPPPPVKKEPPRTVSGGVLNGKATSLPKPAYPPAAKAVRAGGSVTVQVLISETGSVISASAVSGHPLLRPAAAAAARGARFSPTLLSGQPVKVSGVITYNFTP